MSVNQQQGRSSNGDTSPDYDTIYALAVESQTWSRDSHELFDYESRHVAGKKFLVRRQVRVFRSASDVTVVPEVQQLPTAASVDFLLSVKSREGKYYVYPADRTACSTNIQPRKLWLIIKHLQKGEYPLVEGDVIKLGRFKLRVKQIVTETGEQSAPLDFRIDDVEVPATELTPEEALTTQCRICLLEGGMDEDPLVRACQCKGSIMYVHLDCLRHWVNGRLNLTEDPTRTCCFIRQIQCELCKSPFPSTVVAGNNRLPIVKVPNVKPPFIVLENLVGPTNKGVHLCSMAVKKECKLGRGHESDVRIADVSISRFHAVIKLVDNSFILEDHTSKFGTLVALRKPTVIERADKLAVQVGRTVMQFSLEERKASSMNEDVIEIGVSEDAHPPIGPPAQQPPPPPPPSNTHIEGEPTQPHTQNASLWNALSVDPNEHPLTASGPINIPRPIFENTEDGEETAIRHAQGMAPPASGNVRGSPQAPSPPTSGAPQNNWLRQAQSGNRPAFMERGHQLQQQPPNPNASYELWSAFNYQDRGNLLLSALAAIMNPGGTINQPPEAQATGEAQAGYIQQQGQAQPQRPSMFAAAFPQAWNAWRQVAAPEGAGPPNPDPLLHLFRTQAAYFEAHNRSNNVEQWGSTEPQWPHAAQTPATPAGAAPLPAAGSPSHPSFAEKPTEEAAGPAQASSSSEDNNNNDASRTAI